METKTIRPKKARVIGNLLNEWDSKTTDGWYDFKCERTITGTKSLKNSRRKTYNIKGAS